MVLLRHKCILTLTYLTVGNCQIFIFNACYLIIVNSVEHVSSYGAQTYHI